MTGAEMTIQGAPKQLVVARSVLSGLSVRRCLFGAGLVVWISTYIWTSTVIGADETTTLVKVVRFGSLSLMLASELLSRARYGKADLLALVVLFEFALTSFASGRSFLLTGAIVVYLGRNIPFTFIAKCCFYTIACWLAVVLLGVFVGAIDENIVMVGKRRRNSLGFHWPSRGQNLYLALCTMYFFIGKDKHRPVMVVLLALGACAMYRFTGSRSPFLLNMLLCAAALVMDATKGPKSLKPYSWLLTIMFPLMFAFVLAAAWAYDPSDSSMRSVNALFSNRLAYSHSAVTNYPVTLFGESDFGAQNDDFFASYLDSSYLSLLYTYGAPACFIVLAGFVGATRFAVKTEDRFLALCLVITALHGIAEGLLFSVVFTPFMFLLPYGFRQRDEA